MGLVHLDWIFEHERYALDRHRCRPAEAFVTVRAGGVLRVLIVEDEAMITMLLAEVLREMGHEVCATATTEDAAVAAAVLHKPDLMIVDEWLRQGSGISAMAEINRAGYIPHIFVTGDPLIGKSLGPGTIAIQKPFTISELVKAVKSALTTPDGDGFHPHPA
jgi:DNA-binding response OmpR family regulator